MTNAVEAPIRPAPLTAAPPAALAAVLLAALLAPAGARADAPLPPAADQEVRSPNGRCVARAGVTADRTAVTGQDGRGRRVSWDVPGWYRDLYVGNDCRVLGIGYDGTDLLGLEDRDAGTPVVRFFRDGQPARVVRLGELYPDTSVLLRTASHWSWRRAVRWDGRVWTVQTVDGRWLPFEP